MSERRFWDEVQTLPRTELRRLQEERLREAVRRAWDGAGFFRRRFADAGVHPDDIASLDDLRRLPVFRKADLRANEAEHPPIGDHRCVGLHGSVRLADLHRDQRTADLRALDRPRPAPRLRARRPRSLAGGAASGAGRGHRPPRVPQRRPGDDRRRLRAHGDAADLGRSPESFEQAARVLDTIEQLPVDHWRLFPAALNRFREAAARNGSRLRLPDAEAAGPAAQHEKLSAGQECVSYLGSACAPGRGCHIAEDWAIVEVVDVDSGEPLADGCRGSLVVTSLGRDNPMIRYDLEDVVRVESDPCPCGETSRRGFFEGRVRDLVPVAGRRLLPIDVWWELAPDAEFVLVRRPGARRLLVRLEGPVAPDLAERLEARCGVPVDVESLDPGTLARPGYKSVRVVDE